MAFHPSGFHIVVALADKIQMMNVFSNDLTNFKSFGLKACREIQFANGGHLFAAISRDTVQIYNFWTGEQPAHLQYKAHTQPVRCVTWYEDDSGFVSCGADGGVYSFSLKNKEEKDDEFMDKGTTFLNVAKVPEQRTLYAVGTSKKILEIECSKLKDECEVGRTISQIVLSANGKALFVSTAEDSFPGSVQIYKFPFEKTMEI